jgi:hypothetical protein
MSNLNGSQFAVKDWNPFAAASNVLTNVSILENVHHKRALAMIKAHNQTMQQGQHTVPVKREKPTPQNTGAPYPGYKIQGPINPSTTGAPMPGKNNTPTNSVPPVPVKPKGAKPTAPGTPPKPPKKK